MRRYGGHYKISGQPANVLATLDQIVNILPCMHNQLQLHPLKLKRKLEYKSHYIYDMIHKDKVIGAITWLKQHNIHYANVTINSEWGDDIHSGDLSVIIDSGQKCAVVVEGVVDPGNVLNGTVSVSISTLTNEHSKNIAKSSDEHNEHFRNTSNVTDADTSDAEHSDAELKEDCSRDSSYAINEENTNLVAKTFDGQNEHSVDTLNLTETCGTNTNDSDAELKEDQEA